MKQPIKNIMDSDVYTCHCSQTLGDVVEILVEKSVGGLTVIDDDQHVVGFISDGDIMKAVAKQKTRSIYGGDSAMIFYDSEPFEAKVAELKERNVMELATRKVLCATPDQPIDEVAGILSRKKIKKLPVIEKDGTLVGVARRSTIMRHIFTLAFGLPPEAGTARESGETR